MSTPEFIVDHHNKAEQSAYSDVPRICIEFLAHPMFAPVEGFVFGGSYASGNYKEGDDIDVDLLYQELPDIETARNLVITAMAIFEENNLSLHVRGSRDRSGAFIVFHSDGVGEPFQIAPGTEARRRSIQTLGYRYKHPNSPFVARDQEVVDHWHLSS